MSDSRSKDRRHGKQTGGITALFGAITDGYVTLIGQSARCAGDLVGDLTNDISRATNNRNEKSDDENDTSCGCSVTSTTMVDDCVDVIDASIDRFHESLDDRQDADDATSVTPKRKQRASTGTAG